MSKYQIVSATPWWDECMAKQHRSFLRCDAEFWSVLRSEQLSVIVCSKQDSRVFAISAAEQELRCEVTSVFVPQAMGFCFRGQTAAMGAGRAIRVWHDITYRDRSLGAFVPSAVHVVGPSSIHEVAFHPVTDRLLFLNTLFSSVCQLDETASFRQVWRPKFLRDPGPIDCAHVNGMAIKRDGTMVVSMLAMTSGAEGWRSAPPKSGVVYSASSEEPLAVNLSFPHSPAFVGEDLWVLESGTGRLLILSSQGVSTAAEFDGFARGLAVHRNFGLIGLSRLRDGTSPLHREIADTFAQRSCCEIRMFDVLRGVDIGGLNLSGVSEISSIHIYQKSKVVFLDPEPVHRHGHYVISQSGL